MPKCDIRRHTLTHCLAGPRVGRSGLLTLQQLISVRISKTPTQLMFKPSHEQGLFLTLFVPAYLSISNDRGYIGEKSSFSTFSYLYLLGYAKIRDRQIETSLWDWIRENACLCCCHWMLICKPVGVGWGGDDDREPVSETKRIKSCVPYFEGNALSMGRKRRSSGFWGKSLLSPARAGDVPPIKPQLPPSPSG